MNLFYFIEQFQCQIWPYNPITEKEGFEIPIKKTT